MPAPGDAGSDAPGRTEVSNAEPAKAFASEARMRGSAAGGARPLEDEKAKEPLGLGSGLKPPPLAFAAPGKYSITRGRARCSLEGERGCLGV